MLLLLCTSLVPPLPTLPDRACSGPLAGTEGFAYPRLKAALGVSPRY